MGWFTKEAMAFGAELGRQTSILIFGKPPRMKPKKYRRKKTGAQKQYEAAQRWARAKGFK
jgi:hypothetical protein